MEHISEQTRKLQDQQRRLRDEIRNLKRYLANPNLIPKEAARIARMIKEREEKLADVAA